MLAASPVDGLRLPRPMVAQAAFYFNREGLVFCWKKTAKKETAPPAVPFRCQ